VLLHEGRVVASGPPQTVLTAGLIESVYAATVAVGVGQDGRPTVAPVRRPAR
jgi:ABC-type hemin transport system ATPase subunit